MSNSEIAIRVQNLSKRYRIGLEEERHDTFASTIASYIKRPGKNLGRLRRLTRFSNDDHEAADIIWAIKDVSLEVKRGEVLGIIGRNGAGKSTLLKILSRITYPTSGRIELRGRVSSLLEVGTGFHPEMTGRENIYLNGTILGMRKGEIDRKFDEIVDFSGVEKFIDTPVKRYSSGMRVRLAFSVAAHLEPEILLIDEVLSVGDAEFQRKCLGIMGDVATAGRTVLFVSHNMSAVRRLCSKSVLLQEGKISNVGNTELVVTQYLKTVLTMDYASQDFRRHSGRTHSSVVVVTGLSIFSVDTDNTQDNNKRAFDVLVRLDPPRKLDSPNIGITIEDAQGHRICSFGTHFSGVELESIAQPTIVKCTIPELPLLPGTYFLNVAVGMPYEQLLDAIYHAVTFEISPRPSSADMLMSASNHGALQLDATWEIL